MLAVALALASSVAWGVSDFIGGLKSRRLTVPAVLLVSQATGLALVATIVLARGESAPGADFAVYAALSALAGIGGLAALYRGLAVGAMSVVAPISATAVIVPVAVGTATGDRLSAAQIAGIAVAVGGVILAAREPAAAESVAPSERAGTGREPGDRIAAGTGLALLAALGFGCFFVAMDAASDGDVFWAILVNRIIGVSLLVVTALALRPSLAIGSADLVALVSIGVFDITANTLFAIASTKGLVSVVSVLSALYPIVAVVLARAILKERIARPQQAGVALALAGVVLIAGG